jgi:teichuronic acid biosynthesis glycosyltransferase TuaC
MKVLFVCSGNNINSDSNLALSQAKSLIALDIDVELYYINGKGIIGYFNNILPLRRQIKVNGYNIIHAHYGLSGLVALLSKRKRTKLIISFMGNDLLGDHARKGESSFLGSIFVLISRFCAIYADYCIVKSAEMSEKIQNSYSSVIPNGVDIARFHFMDKPVALKRVGWNPNIKHILFLSDPSRPEKNFELTEAAINKLTDESIKLHSLRNVHPDDVVFYYNAADACVLTSFHEGSPNVIKEAMACNSSIVSTNVGDTKWVMNNTQGCFICTYDPEDVAKKIRLAIEFKKLNGNTKGREQIKRLNLDSESVAKKIIEIYKKVLNLQS